MSCKRGGVAELFDGAWVCPNIDAQQSNAATIKGMGFFSLKLLIDYFVRPPMVGAGIYCLRDRLMPVYHDHRAYFQYLTHHGYFQNNRAIPMKFGSSRMAASFRGSEFVDSDLRRK